MTHAFTHYRQQQLVRFLAVLLSITFCASLTAAEQSQTLILVGSELSSCSSLNMQQCDKNTQIAGKAEHLFSVTAEKVKKITQQWPSTNQEVKSSTVKVLLAIKAKSSASITKPALLWHWRDIDNTQLNSLSEQEYHFVMDMLEVPQFSSQGQRLAEQVNPSLNNEPAINNILQFITGSLKVANEQPSVLAITAASRDPYAAADFTQGLLSTASVNSQWLALTPALVKAITTNTCEKLPQYRQSEMRLYNREAIYPDRIQAENTLCSNGVNSLVKLINNSTGVIFNNGEQDLTRSVLFDENNQAYPWTKALQTRPVVIGSGAGAAIQSGGKNTSGNIATITKGSSLLALQADINDSSMFNLAGGLATFNYGMIDTHFSEQNRTLRLATVLDKTQQKFGFGIDEATALVVIKSSAGNLITVIGKSGVVYLKAKGNQHYNYSYWPAGSVIDIANEDFTLSQRSINKALASIKIPALPLQRFGSILTNAKLRSLIQAMCLSQEQSTVAQQDQFILSLSVQANTAYHRINKDQYGCAISHLELAVSTF